MTGSPRPNDRDERAAATVEQERIDAAVFKIERVLARLPILGAFPTEKRLLEEARDLLNPEVKLA